MPDLALSEPKYAIAKKSPCGGCQRQKFLEFVETTKPDGWQQLEVDLREPCPCISAKLYAEGIEEACDSPPSNYWHVLENNETYFDIYEDFIQSFGFSGSAEVRRMPLYRVLTVLSERVKK